MNLKPFIMESWLAACKDASPYNLGESGVPALTVGELLGRVGETPEVLGGITLTDPDTRGTDRLRRAIAATYADPAITPDTLTVTTGTSEALFILYHLLLADRPAAVVPFPAFQALYEVPRALGADLRFYRHDPARGWRLDPQEVCALIDDRTGVVVVNTPHNPSGVVVDREDARAIIEQAGRCGATVVFDEHYRFLPLAGNAPAPSWADPARGVVATGSITKCFGVTGLRVGWIAAPPALVERVCSFRDYLTHTLSPVSDYLAARAIEERERFIPPVLECLRENIRAMSDFIARTPGWSWTEPDGGVVGFPAYGGGMDSEAFARRLLEKGVFVLPGSAFEVEGFVRVNLSQPPALFAEALARIGEAAGEGGGA